MVNFYWRKLVGYARSKNAIIQVPITKRQRPQLKTLRSSLVKSQMAKKVSFGGVDKRLYEVNSQASTEVEARLFPDLTQLTPMHKASIEIDTMSDSECSA